MMLLQAGALAVGGIRHAFFTRDGGASEGVYASLNCSLGSGDDAGKVDENRRRAAAALGVAPDQLVTPYQEHGVAVAAVARPWRQADRPRADALMTRAPGIALGILTADCAPVLFADPTVPMVAAAHAGWRGAVGGVIEATLAAMEQEGATRASIRAAIGPCIGGLSYEVGPEFPAPFLAESADNMQFFMASPRAGHWRFDLGRYVEAKLRRLGIRVVERIAGDTCAESERFFSYRRACLAGERRFGHLLSAICLAP